MQLFVVHISRWIAWAPKDLIASVRKRRCLLGRSAGQEPLLRSLRLIDVAHLALQGQGDLLDAR